MVGWRRSGSSRCRGASRCSGSLAAVAARRLGGGTLALAGWIGLAEVARSLLFTGFPWALLGHVWIGTPIAQLAGFVGPFGLTAVTLAAATCLALAPRRPLAVIPLLGLPVLWLTLDPGPLPSAPEAGPLVRIVQPAVPQDEKWSAGAAAQFADLLALSAAEPPAALTVWPETALPWVIDLEATPDLAALADLPGAVATGVVRWQDERYFNSLAVFGAGGGLAARYDKWHLVPFGEYLPAGALLSRIGLRGLAEFLPGGFSTGTGPATVEIPGIGPASALICYEGIFAEEVNAVRTRPRLLLLVTNDAWFGTRAGPQQHFAQGRLRAIEQGVPMVRAANTGISGVIDGRGRVVASLGLGEKGALVAPLPPALAPPLYSRTGDWPAIVLLGVVALGAALTFRRFSD